LPNKATELLNRINLGINCCNEERELNIATAYLDILRCYITDWENPYLYGIPVIEGPYIDSVNIEVELSLGTANSEIFTSISITTGYGVSYDSPVSITTLISDYIAATGQNMILVSIDTSHEGVTVYEISIQVPCEYANSDITTVIQTSVAPYSFNTKGPVGDCTTTFINIPGPTYTNQDSANCLTREEVVNMFEWLQKYCCMCFPNYGNYDNVVIID
jgi:hypothetical protein